MAFRGCKASGLAALPPGQKHHGTKPDFRVPSRISGNQVGFIFQAVSAIEVQEMKSPGSGVQGAEQAPCLVVTLCNIPVKHFVVEKHRPLCPAV